MKNFVRLVRIPTLIALALAGFTALVRAQEVSIPDPALNAAVRAALQKPSGPLTEQDMLTLTNLDAKAQGVTRINGLETARNLTSLNLDSNSITNFVLPSSLTNLESLILLNNHLTNFALASGFEKLTQLDLGFNAIDECSLPNGLTNLATLFLDDNLLTNITLPAGLTQLTEMDLSGNSLSSLSLPTDMTNLVSLSIDGNPLTALVLSEQMAAGNLADAVALIRTEKFSVFTYPLIPQLTAPRVTVDGNFEFAVTGPPGTYIVQRSIDLKSWIDLITVTNVLGVVRSLDPLPALSGQKFYRARLLP